MSPPLVACSRRKCIVSSSVNIKPLVAKSTSLPIPTRPKIYTPEKRYISSVTASTANSSSKSCACSGGGECPIPQESVVLKDLFNGLHKRNLHDFAIYCSSKEDDNTNGQHDNNIIHIPKILLMCQSKVLEKQWKHKDSAKMRYSKFCIQAALEYCTTHDLCLWTLPLIQQRYQNADDENNNNDENNSNKTDVQETIQELVRDLCRLGQGFAQDYGISGLSNCVHDALLYELIPKHPWMAAIIWDEIHVDYAWQVIASRPHECLLQEITSRSFNDSTMTNHHHKPEDEDHEDDDTFASDQTNRMCGAQFLSKPRLEEILRNRDWEQQEFLFFQIVSKWYNAHSRDTNNDDVDSDLEEKVNDSFSSFNENNNKDDTCKKYCQELIAQHIELRHIEPSELITTVKESGLVADPTDILDAMADQALEAQMMDGLSFSNYRGPQHLERIVVSGAGIPQVNGVYQRQSRHTYGDCEALYCQGDEYGIYLWNNIWHLAPVLDLSNLMYSSSIGRPSRSSSSFAATRGSSSSSFRFGGERTSVANKNKNNNGDNLGSLVCLSTGIPSQGWKTEGNGQDPPPTLRFLRARDLIPSRRFQRGAARNSLPACYIDHEDFLGN